MGNHENSWLGPQKRAKPLVRAGVLLGLGLGGFFDGIVIHQILQWHHMLTSHPNPSVANDIRLNMMADGLFHVATYAFTVLGIVLLWRAWRTPVVPRSGRTLLGSTVLGWGCFNLIEGIVDHHLLGIHHVWPAGPGPVLLWDLVFLASGVLFVVVGYIVIRNTKSVPEPSETETISH
ncbi:DUF2243 domain-containing protein [Haladaptatus caseinilyticus]|uniref:DUF2243 domain-containing protein n=1 Tax=Haladaptatus caseinilyticus TaxID=2993314 RepID=UPI00224B9968|nr:DUF2243 domain-containing protein [Haladaptatus caseinilyticus]